LEDENFRMEGDSHPNRAYKCVLIYSTAGDTGHNFMVVPIEKNRWQALLFATNGDMCGTSIDDAHKYLETASHKWAPVLFSTLVKKYGFYHPSATSTTSDDIRDPSDNRTDDNGHTNSSNGSSKKGSDPSRGIFYAPSESCQHHYSAMENFPERLWVTGDAFASFNPIYGQGMTMAVIYANAFNELLKADLYSAGPHEDWIENRLQGVLDSIRGKMSFLAFDSWTLATTEDLKWSKTTHNLSPIWRSFYRVTGAFVEMLMHAAAVDSDIAHRFFRIQSMVDPFLVSFSPTMLLPIIYHWFFTPPPNKNQSDSSQASKNS